MKSIQDVLIVSFDFEPTGDAVAVIGRKKLGTNVEPINYFHGQEARDLHTMLSEKKIQKQEVHE